MRLILASASPRRRQLLNQVGLYPEVIPSRTDETTGGLPPEEMVRELSARKAGEVAARLAGGSGSAEERKQNPGPGGAGCAGEGGRDEAAGGGLSGGRAIREETVILGADTVVTADGRILGKPGSEEEAARMLSLLQGRTHRVCTGVTMIFLGSGERITFDEQTEVTVYPMSSREIRDYIATGEPMDKAGAYGIQGRFAAYVRGIRGDYNNVVGLPLARVCRELIRRGLF